MFSGLIITITLSLLLVTVNSFDSGNKPTERSLTKQPATHLLGVETGRRKHSYYYDDMYPFYGYHGWYALTWIYWIKVKLVIVAFFAYTAYIWALKYVQSYYNQCSNSGGQHAYYSHGHYRSLDDVQIPKILQQIKKTRKRRHLRKGPNVP